MNREIKFRAWVFDKMKQLDVLAIGEVSWSCGDGVGVSMAYQPDFKVMQYTGLKDKNDKEIYEGDVVKVSPDRGKTWDTGEVVYGSFAAFSVFLRDIGPGIKSPLLNFCGNTMSLLPDVFIEVIGNIYENPELLNQDKDE